MTATPKVYGDVPKKQESLGDVVLYSMDNEQIFGPVFYSMSFDEAVKMGCLVDFEVTVLVLRSALIWMDCQQAVSVT